MGTQGGSSEGAQLEGAFAFAPETDVATVPEAALARTALPTVLTVDDDAAFQRSIQLALGEFEFQGEPVRLLSASSAAEAGKILAATPDVAVIVLDVVMETDDAGLRLVRSVREVLGNAEVRIVLVTGQPGMAPMGASLATLDISDYWLKTDLTFARLRGVLTSNLRTWRQIRSLEQARKGLQTIVEASNGLTRARSLPDFSQRMILELSRLLGVGAEGLVCVQEDPEAPEPLSARIIGAAGRLAHSVNRELRCLGDTPVRDLLGKALAERANVETADSQVLFFPGAQHGPHAATYIATDRLLDETEQELLRVFATHINSGLINVSLTSRLDRLAYEDSLLSMPNANALLRSLTAILDLPAPRDRSMLLIELDQYSSTCLSLGVEQGDIMLQQMARRLRAIFPAPTLVARLHDDTFAILGHTELLQQDRIDELQSVDIDDPDHPSFIRVRSARVNLDEYCGTARGAMAMGTLLLRRAQSRGATEIVEYEPGLEREMQQRFTLSRELYRALRCGEISIELQPQIDLRSGRITGAEALARWTRRDGTRVPPSEFIPVAEANGLIVPMGKQVLRLACEALAQLRDAGYPDISVSVNVSPLQLVRRDFMQELIDMTRQYGVPPERLEIEITETAAIEDYEANGQLLRGLRSAGFPIAIDDFGTGYSSLAHLSSMPATTLKVDRHFVNEIDTAPGRHTIADMIIGLGRRLNMQVLAEGVESETQAGWLVDHACSRAQGFFYARPEPLSAFMQRLAAR
ncbi:putative bifunctional diguanylate cyclase/phosphodiesterase [Bordetella genomosp. 13]|uniref:putative bifunctional diguanylate cyclase/phosphodiesterase n=1 Tax=Bordetella genomosp. 13 TaxID=463040 RepID=UPI00164263CC|nr:EAL domain-containing protein [Bordetella genomosp. 13]